MQANKIEVKTAKPPFQARIQIPVIDGQIPRWVTNSKPLNRAAKIMEAERHRMEQETVER